MDRFGMHAGFVTASIDTTTRVWNADGTQLATLNHDDIAGWAQFSPDGTRIVTASANTTVPHRSVPNGTVRLGPQVHERFET